MRQERLRRVVDPRQLSLGEGGMDFLVTDMRAYVASAPNVRKTRGELMPLFLLLFLLQSLTERLSQ